MHFSALKFQDFLGKHAPRKRPPFCLSKARKTNLFNATVKEAKVKDFAILFLALSWFHQGNHKNCLLIFQRAHWLIFAETFLFHTLYLSGVSHSIIFYKNWDCLSYGTHTQCSFSRLNFLMYSHIIFGGWSCVISMNRCFPTSVLFAWLNSSG